MHEAGVVLSKLSYARAPYGHGTTRDEAFLNSGDSDMRTSLRLAFLASSTIVGFSYLLEPASAAPTTAASCSAALMNKSRAAIERFLKEYPLGAEACLATAKTSQEPVSRNDRGDHDSSSGSGAGN